MIEQTGSSLIQDTLPYTVQASLLYSLKAGHTLVWFEGIHNRD